MGPSLGHGSETGIIFEPVVYTYAVDKSDRLWTEEHFDGSPMSGGTATETINYRWDSNGFLIRKISSTSDEQHTANAEGRLAAYLKDSVTTTGTRTITDLVSRHHRTADAVRTTLTLMFHVERARICARTTATSPAAHSPD
ncbi:MAG: hypothetical protein ACIARQ_17170 [Phycisphaerales bacterium JB061]